MWFFDFAPHWREDKSLKYRLLFFWAAFVFLSGLYICGAGVSRSTARDIRALLTNIPLDVRLGHRHQDQLREQRWNLPLEL